MASAFKTRPHRRLVLAGLFALMASGSGCSGSQKLAENLGGTFGRDRKRVSETNSNKTMLELGSRLVGDALVTFVYPNSRNIHESGELVVEGRTASGETVTLTEGVDYVIHANQVAPYRSFAATIMLDEYFDSFAESDEAAGHIGHKWRRSLEFARAIMAGLEGEGAVVRLTRHGQNIRELAEFTGNFTFARKRLTDIVESENGEEGRRFYNLLTDETTKLLAQDAIVRILYVSWTTMVGLNEHTGIAAWGEQLRDLGIIPVVVSLDHEDGRTVMERFAKKLGRYGLYFYISDPADRTAWASRFRRRLEKIYSVTIYNPAAYEVFYLTQNGDVIEVLPD